jgi:hypothetical protein|tara:strand:+ start:887 stop:1153 length:267 start_codon:yes stop_codon:yes gene_type:complete
MTLETLQMIIDENWESAKNGNASAFSAVIGAQAEIKKINQQIKQINYLKKQNPTLQKVVANEIKLMKKNIPGRKDSPVNNCPTDPLVI